MCIRDSTWRGFLASGDAQSLPLFQQLARGDPPRGDDVYPLSAVAATGRGYSVRAGNRHLPRDGSVLVEPLRSDVRQRDQEATPSSSVVFAMALAPGRGVRQDQWRDAYLWRAVDHEGEVLEVFVTKRRDRRAALKFLKRTMKRYGRPRSIVTDPVSY